MSQKQTEVYYPGEEIEHRIIGYGLYKHEEWIPAVVLEVLPQRIKVKFKLKNGKELIRYTAHSTLRKKQEDHAQYQ